MKSPSIINELRDLVFRSCCEHQEQASRTIDGYGKELGSAVYQMLADDLEGIDEPRGEFAAWLLAELIVFDLMRHPDGKLLISWFSLPPYPTCSEDGPEKQWSIESQSLSESLSLQQACDLFALALQSSSAKVRKRAERAWRDIKSISGSDYNPCGTTLLWQFGQYRNQIIERLTLAASAEDVESRDAAEWALAVCQNEQDG